MSEANAPTVDRGLPTLAAGFIVFVGSFVTLVLEILGSRLLAPYIGVTLQTYTAVIGTILTGISLGTWIGGVMADRFRPRSSLGPIICIGGLCVLLTVPIARWLGPDLGERGAFLTVVFTFATLFFPAAVLSAINPTIVKLQLLDLNSTGRTVGRLSALATSGAIIGTFATGFFLVRSFHVATVIAASGVVLIGAGLLLSVVLHVGRKIPPIAVVIFLFASVCGFVLTTQSKSPCRVESSYFCIQVLASADNPNLRILKLDNYLHSQNDVTDPTNLVFLYTKILGGIASNVSNPGTPISMLSVGAGALTLPQYVAATRPGSYNKVLEIDPALIQVDKKYFNLQESDLLNVQIGDARTVMPKLAGPNFDLVVGDAFGGESVPWQLTTNAFDRQIKMTLKPGGLYAMNMIDYRPLNLVRWKVKTLQSVFSHVFLINAANSSGEFRGGNVELIATDRDLTAAEVRSWMPPTDLVVLTGTDLDNFVGNAQVLTDDYAPVDQLITQPHR